MTKHIYAGILSCYLWVVRLPSQNSGKAQLVRADNQWGGRKPH